jgi:hypothetical protein
MKYKNKNGISLNYTSDDIHTNLVKEVISEAINILDSGNSYTRHNDCKEFLKENFNIKLIGDL